MGEPVQSMSGDFDLVEAYRRLVTRWYWVAAAGLAAGLLGLLVSGFRPPLYESSTSLVIGIDRGRADVPDDVTVRQAYDRVRGLLLADDTLNQAIALAAADPGGGTTTESAADLRGRIRLAEEPEGWELIVASPDGIGAERMAQAWAEASLAALGTASYHAIRAAEWQTRLYEASCRLVPGSSGSEAAKWRCLSTPSVGEAGEIPASILAEVESSRGILPGFSYSLLTGSGGTARPVVWSRGILILGATVVGIVLGMLAAVGWKRSRTE